ncbi:hypothetical protein E4T56_gene18215 [Termitomyces sp. T112]|nr:hypothetical protein E4T56_gene18215 [Termitomyces sp. T112]
MIPTSTDDSLSRGSSWPPHCLWTYRSLSILCWKGFPRTIYFVDPLPKDAKAIDQIYRVMISLAITRIVSTLVLHPTAPTWSNAFQMAVKSASRDQKYYTLAEDFFLQILEPYQFKGGREHLMMDKNAWDALDDDKRKQLGELKQRFPWMAVWQTFFIRQEAQDMLKDIDRLVIKESFPEIIPSAILDHKSPVHASLAFSSDAINTAWGQIVSSWVGEPEPLKIASSCKSHSVITGSLRRSARLTSSKAEIEKRANQKWPTVIVPDRNREMTVVDEGMDASS